MLADTFSLFRLYWRIDRRADRGTGVLNRAITIAVGLFLILFSAIVGLFAASQTFDFLPTPIDVGVLPGLLLTVVLFGVVMTGFGQALQALYLSDDLEKLIVTPIYPQAIMTAKLLSRVPSTILMLLVLTIPALISYGIFVELGAIYYLVGLLLILLSPLFGLSIGALVAMFMVRLLPARRLNEWIGAASIVIGLLLSLVVALPYYLNKNSQPIDTETLAAVDAMLNHLGELPLPSMWAGHVLVELGQGRFAAPALSVLAIYLLITVGLFLATIFLSNRLYLGGWLRMQSSGAVTQDIGERPGIFGRSSLDFILGYKDWLLRIRDPRLMATLFTTLILSILLLFMFLRPQSDGSSLLAIQRVDGGVNYFSPGVIISGLIYFIAWFAFFNLSLTALSIERAAIYILETAPLSPGRLMHAKTLSIFVPYALMVTAGLLGAAITFNLNLVWLPYGWMVLMLMGYGLYTYLISVAFLYPKFNWDDPRKMTNRKATIPAVAGGLVYSVFAIILAVATYGSALTRPELAIPIMLLGLALLAGGTWFFRHWCTSRVESTWAHIIAEWPVGNN